MPLRGSPALANGYYDSDGSVDEEDPFVEIVEGAEGYSPQARPPQVAQLTIELRSMLICDRLPGQCYAAGPSARLLECQTADTKSRQLL